MKSLLLILVFCISTYANPHCPVETLGKATNSPHLTNHFFVRFTPASTFPSSTVTGFIEMSTNGRFDRTGYDVNRSTWPEYYAHFQTIRNTFTFELKDFWNIQYLPSPTWGVFRISQSGNTYTLWRIHNQQQYVTVMVADSYGAIVDRLQMIYINGTPEHREAITNLDILSYRIN